MTDYSFFNLGRIGADEIDDTQRDMFNSRYSNYALSNFFDDSNSHIDFATAHPQLTFNAVNGGSGVGGAAVDSESQLKIQVDQTRNLERLQLNSRPFATVPYLGRGSCDPALELQLLQGENSQDKKSVSTIMSKSFLDYSMYPTDAKMEEFVQHTANTVEEAALDGWVRGGMLTREMASDGHYSAQGRPATNL
jgi:hypothetical protein